MIVKILGTGCANCRRAEALVREVVAEMGIDAQVEKEDNVAEIMNYGVMSTPALVINDKVVSSGQVPSKANLTTLLVNAQLASEAAQ